MQSTLRDLEDLARETGATEEEILARALREGARHLRREQVLDRYLRQDITREEAAKQVGLHWVKQAERQARAIDEDIEWARQR